MKEKVHHKKGHVRHVLLICLIVFLGLILVGLIAFYFIFNVADWQKLDMNRITGAAQTGIIYDRFGNKISNIQGTENRVPISISQVPEDVQNAFLAAEDLRFYKHHGFDIVRIFGALVSNFKSQSYSEGASTITQQLIKLSHLSSQKTVARKLEEVWLAVQLESKCSKKEILEMYLNYVYFGSGAYGLQAASQAYFGIDASALTLAQGASLAAIINAPGIYSPFVDVENNKKRQTYILDTMLENSMITQEKYEQAISEEQAFLKAQAKERAYGWYLDAVLEEAEQQLDISAATLLSSGYRIYTALDPESQSLLETLYTKDLFPKNASDGIQAESASAVLDVKTGAVLAIVGGRSYSVQRGLNRATQLRRQPGSALKPLVCYAPAIENFGFTAATVLSDEPTNFGGYNPRNSGNAYYGFVTVRSSLAYSLNIPAVKTLQTIGVTAGRNYLKSVGIEPDERDANLALALGAMTYGVSPVQLAGAYAPFANSGVYNAPFFVTKITDSSGAVLYLHESEPRQVLSAQSAYIMTSLLQSVTSSGTGAKLSQAGTPVAGKTGTVNMAGGNRDVWMAAYNSEISMAVWMGFDNPDANHRLAGWVSGGDNPAALARDYFKAAYAGKSKPQFSRPGGIVSQVIDTKAVKTYGQAMLASSLTPDSYKLSEIFSEGNKLSSVSNVWNAPKTLASFTISHSNDGYPVLVLGANDTAVYRVQRDAVGESFILTELWGSAGETLYYTDRSAKAGVVYTYRVTPVNAELLQNGTLLEGAQSVQIAQVISPKSENPLNELFGLIFSDENDKKAIPSISVE